MVDRQIKCILLHLIDLLELSNPIVVVDSLPNINELATVAGGRRCV
jgi:hypothetical protein